MGWIAGEKDLSRKGKEQKKNEKKRDGDGDGDVSSPMVPAGMAPPHTCPARVGRSKTFLTRASGIAANH